MDKDIKGLINQTAHTLSQRQHAIYRQCLAEAVMRLALTRVPRAEIVAYLDRAAVDGNVVLPATGEN